MARIGINGLGRIGRCVFRTLCEDKDSDLKLVAVNGSSDVAHCRHLLKYDSVHGRFGCEIDTDGEDSLVVDGDPIRVFRERDPEKISWGDLGVDIVLECTGKFNSKSLSSKHIRDTVKRVLVSAPVDDSDCQIIFGVNEDDIRSDYRVISLGSCTTNCAAHLVKIMDENFGIDGGFITTVHAYTKDQNHVDGSHKDMRRARACGLSIIPTTTGAHKSLEILFPHLKGRISASSIRIPTPNVSLVDFSFTSPTRVTTESINDSLVRAAELRPDILLASKDPLVSSDFNHTIYSAVFDLMETYTTKNNFSRVLAWYDNEWAFAARMVDVSNMLCGFI